MWDHDNITTLKALMKNGHSYRSAANVMGTTVNAIAGACHRHKIHSTHMIPPKKSKPSRYPIETALQTEFTPLNIPINKTTTSQCRWPTAQDADGIWSICCGHPINPIAICRYCAHHASIAYRALQPRREVRQSYAR